MVARWWRPQATTEDHLPALKTPTSPSCFDGAAGETPGIGGYYSISHSQDRARCPVVRACRVARRWTYKRSKLTKLGTTGNYRQSRPASSCRSQPGPGIGPPFLWNSSRSTLTHFPVRGQRLSPGIRFRQRSLGVDTRSRSPYPGASRDW